jgi:tRNA (adenine57-N1/adenine58-N1)-methyltransferase catalytic subunit
VISRRRGPFHPGDQVQLTDPKGRLHLVLLQPGRLFHTHRGAVAHDDLIGADEGSVVRSTGGTPYVALRPLLADFTLSMTRGAAVVYPKDAAQIVAMADVFPGALVLEAGAGSGALACWLLRAVGEGGRLVSYERREDFAGIARANVERFFGGPHPAWELRTGELPRLPTACPPPDDGLPAPPDDGLPAPPDDGLPAPPDDGLPAPPGDGLPAPPDDSPAAPPAGAVPVPPPGRGTAPLVEGEPFDRVVLDMLAPWDYVATAAHALIPGGVICCYVATVSQLSKTVETLRGHGAFAEPAAWESFTRGWHCEGLAVRPEHRMVGHTGFLVTARRLAAGTVAPPRRRRPAKGAGA